jgi:hypothetical protein
VRDLAGRSQSRPGRRPQLWLRTRLVEDAAGVVEAAGKLQGVVVGADALAAGAAAGATDRARRAGSNEL